MGVRKEDIIQHTTKKGKVYSFDKIKKIVSDYQVYNLTPDRFIENGKIVEDILDTITAVVNRDVEYSKEDRAIVYDMVEPLYYEILYSGGKAKFNWVLPDKYGGVITKKITSVYKSATFKREEDYFNRFKDNMYGSLVFKNHYIFSLNVDYREVGLIENLLNLSGSVDKDDEVLFQIGIVPLDDYWRTEWDTYYKKFKSEGKLEVNRGIVGKGFSMVNSVVDECFSIFDMVMTSPKQIKETKDKKEKKNKEVEKEKVVLTSDPNRKMTLSKGTRNGYKINLKVFCNDDSKLMYYTKLFYTAFKVLDAEQQIVVGGYRNNKGRDRCVESSINSKDVMNTKELGMFLQLPNRRLQLQYLEFLKSVDAIETDIPRVLRESSIPICYCSYKGEKLLVGWNTTNYDMVTMHKIITGLQRTGKSSYLKNFALFAMRAGHSVIVIDTIKDCELANDIRDYMPKEFEDKIIVLDFGNLDYLLPLVWNELRQELKNATKFKDKMKIASYMTQSLKAFLETVNEHQETKKFSPKMEKFLASAGRVVLSQEGTNIMDVYKCLVDYDVRHKFIESSGIPSDDTAVVELLRLDDVTEIKGTDDKGKKCVVGYEYGTKFNLIDGIIDRFSLLTNDFTTELMFSAPAVDTLDFTKWSNEGYCVLIKASELEISRPALKPLVTFLYSKIWTAMISRGKIKQPKCCHVLLDEIHNFPQVCDMLRGNCREAAKYGLSYVFTAHMLKDLKDLLPVIIGSGGNLMTFKTTKDNFNLMEKEFTELGFDMDECLRIKDRHALCYVNYDREYTLFEGKVVEPVDKVFEKFDRSDLDLKHSIKYGVYFD